MGPAQDLPKRPSVKSPDAAKAISSGQVRGRSSYKLTDAAVRSFTLPPGKHDYTFFDDKLKGFGLRLREPRSRSFIFQYDFAGKTRRMVLGTAGAVDVAQVRKEAQKLHLRVKAGEDPAIDKAVSKQQAAATFKAAIDEYLEMARKTLRPRTYPDVERHLVKFAKQLHGLPLAKITRADVRRIVAAVSKNSGEVTGNRCRASLSAFFAWAVAEKDLAVNPVIGVKRNAEKSRERVLLPAELRAIWNALDGGDYADIIRLLALTGCRAAEIAGLRWSEVQGDVIILPGTRTKNHRPHTVPLSPAASAILARRQKRDDRELVFGRGQQAFSGWSRCKERLDERIAKANNGKPIPHWTPHDLRRTFATYAGGGLPEHLIETLKGTDKKLAGGLGIGPHIIEAVLNHVSGHKAGVAGTYNRSTYPAEKRQAVERWAEHLAAIIEGRESNVLTLRA
jgi:integrase